MIAIRTSIQRLILIENVQLPGLSDATADVFSNVTDHDTDNYRTHI